MALVKGKYQRLSIDIEKSEYRELLIVVRAQGCSIVHFVRAAIRGAMPVKDQYQHRQR